MTSAPLAKRMTEMSQAYAPFSRFQQSNAARKSGEPGVCNFLFGNPQQMPMPELVAAFQKWIPPQDKDWYAYKMSVPSAGRRRLRAARTPGRAVRGRRRDDDDRGVFRAGHRAQRRRRSGR
jgi:hypothetical protein